MKYVYKNKILMKQFSIYGYWRINLWLDKNHWNCNCFYETSKTVWTILWESNRIILWLDILTVIYGELNSKVFTRLQNEVVDNDS